MSQSTKRVFLSYGTGDAIEVAQWLHEALTSRGYQVFWDKEGLRKTTGTAWAGTLRKRFARTMW